MVTDLPSTFKDSFLDLTGYRMAQKAAQDCYSQSGLTPRDVDVLEVHDCFSCNEVGRGDLLCVHRYIIGGVKLSYSL